MFTKPGAVLIFIHHRNEVDWAIDYLHRHPRQKVLIFPTDISALSRLYQLDLRLINRIDTYVTRTRSLDRLVPLPLKLTRRLLQFAPSHLHLLIDTIRHQLVKNLSAYYVLNKIIHDVKPHQLIVSPASFPPFVVKLITQTYPVKFKLLPSPRPNSIQVVAHRFNQLYHQLQFLLLHLGDVAKLFSLPPSFPPGKKHVLVFSNGLNLASYHSLFKSLGKQNIHVTLLTDHQSIADKLVLAHYNLPTQQINLVPSLPLPSLNLQLPQFKPLSFINSHQLRQLIHTTVTDVWRSSGPKIWSKYQAAQSYLHSLKPDAVLVTHDPGPSGLAFIKAAQHQDLPNLVLLHGSPSAIHFFQAGKQLIWGDLMKRWLVAKAQVGPRRLITGGHPIYHDYLDYFRTRSHSSPVLTLGILATGDGHYEWHQALYFLDLFRALTLIDPATQVLIRTHGMQNLASLLDLARQFNLLVTVNPPVRLEEFISRCDVVITQNSTAALVPLLAAKPTILADPWFPFLDEGLIKHSLAFLKLKSWSQLPNLITQSARPQTKFVQSYCGKLDANTGQRLAQAIIRHLKLQ